MVERQKPDVVVEVIVERLLHELPEQYEPWAEARRRRNGSEALEKK